MQYFIHKYGIIHVIASFSGNYSPGGPKDEHVYYSMDGYMLHV